MLLDLCKRNTRQLRKQFDALDLPSDHVVNRLFDCAGSSEFSSASLRSILGWISNLKLTASWAKGQDRTWTGQGPFHSRGARYCTSGLCLFYRSVDYGHTNIVYMVSERVGQREGNSRGSCLVMGRRAYMLRPEWLLLGIRYDNLMRSTSVMSCVHH